MKTTFFSKPDKLPERIDPCPIIEAVLEIRFVTGESWSVLPGLLYSRIRERYPEKIELPLCQIPEEVRRREETLTYQPLVRFLSQDFLIQFGPRVISLVTKPGAYPGWAATRYELGWLLDQIQKAGFMDEGERIGVRYIDFFHSANIFHHLDMRAELAGLPASESELTLATVIQEPPFTARLHITNSAIVGQGESHQIGSVLDLDVWIGSLDFSIFENGINRFDEAHLLVKQIFFGLLKPDYLSTLNPVYS